MSTNWQPSQEGLAELVQLFRDSQSPQMDVQERIAQVRFFVLVRVTHYLDLFR